MSHLWSYDQPVKVCRHCGETKRYDEFYGDPQGEGRLSSRVQSLQSRDSEQRSTHADPQRYIDRVRQWQQANPERSRIDTAANIAGAPSARAADREGYLKRKYGITVD